MKAKIHVPKAVEKTAYSRDFAYKGFAPLTQENRKMMLQFFSSGLGLVY